MTDPAKERGCNLSLAHSHGSMTAKIAHLGRERLLVIGLSGTAPNGLNVKQIFPILGQLVDSIK